MIQLSNLTEIFYICFLAQVYGHVAIWMFSTFEIYAKKITNLSIGISVNLIAEVLFKFFFNSSQLTEVTEVVHIDA